MIATEEQKDAAIIEAGELWHIPSWRRRRRKRRSRAMMLLYDHRFLSPLVGSWRGLAVGAIVSMIALGVVMPAYLLIFWPLRVMGLICLLGISSVALVVGIRVGETLMRRCSLAKRAPQELDGFVRDGRGLAPLPLEYVRSVRDSIASAYGVPSERIRAADGAQSLSAFMFTGEPWAHEILADTLRRLGRSNDYLDAARRLLSEPYPDVDNVADAIAYLYQFVYGLNSGMHAG